MLFSLKIDMENLKVYDLEGGITAWIEKEKALPNK